MVVVVLVVSGGMLGWQIYSPGSMPSRLSRDEVRQIAREEAAKAMSRLWWQCERYGDAGFDCAMGYEAP